MARTPFINSRSCRAIAPIEKLARYMMEYAKKSIGGKVEITSLILVN